MRTVDCLVFGGGAAGLFTLAELLSRGARALLLESRSLGAGQTRCAQGIIHGGVKYSLRGLIGADSRAISQMPERWLRMAEGRATPSLRGATIRSRHCWLWRSDGLKAKLGMLGARLALRVRPEEVAPSERPELLRAVAGSVMRLPEPIFDPCSVLAALAKACAPHLGQYDAASLEVLGEEQRGLRLRATMRTHGGSETVELLAGCVILAAGVGNEPLRAAFSLAPGRTQRRPLHQVLLRSPSLPWFDGHCIDGDATRLTITSARDERGWIVWHLGGRLAEDGVRRDPVDQVKVALAELRAVLPASPLDGAEITSYRVDRAEPNEQGRRPDDARLIEEGRVLTLWPTKLALAPRAAELASERARDIARFWRVSSLAGHGHARACATRRTPLPHGAPSDIGIDFPPPPLAAPPWHDALEWRRLP